MLYGPTPDVAAQFSDSAIEAIEGVALTLLDKCKQLRAANNRTDTSARPDLRSLENVVSWGTSALRNIHNDTRAVNRLPAEILVYIFSMLPDRHPVPTKHEGDHWPFSIPDISIYVETARVCRRWRDLIFDTPTLWAVVSETRHVRERPRRLWYLKHCPRGPLTVNIDSDAPDLSDSMVQFIRTQGSRIQQLHIASLGRAPAAIILPLLLALPADQLEHCKIGFASCRTERLLRLFSGKGDKLRSLYLECVPFLPSNLFPSLTRLVIYRNYTSDEPLWDMGDLARLLSGSPMLEELHLCHVWRLAAPSLPSSNRSTSLIALNHLRAFSLKSHIRISVATFQTFISLIRFPPSCSFQVGRFGLEQMDAVGIWLRSLGRPYTRMRLTLTNRVEQEVTWALELASSQHSGGLCLLLDYFDLRQPPIYLSRFIHSPLLADVEELWFITDRLSDVLFRVLVPLPPKVRCLALTAINNYYPSNAFKPLASIVAQLDTLCICISSAEQLSLVSQVFSGGSPPSQQKTGRTPKLRRLAIGYLQPSSRMSRGNISLTQVGIEAETSWIKRVPKGREGKEMDWLLKEVPQVLEPPATIRADWPRMI